MTVALHCDVRDDVLDKLQILGGQIDLRRSEVRPSGEASS
jgi:hypothetical protein